MRTILVGPTAVGKTSLSLKLARKLNAEIISADSRQCYKYLDIGTASPSEEELSLVRHHNISIFEPDKKVNASDFCERAIELEKEIKKRKKHPLYVGGSTLYIQCIISPFDPVPASSNKNIEKLEKEIREKGIESLYNRLNKIDPEYANRMDGFNTQRIIRALDVWLQTGKPFSSFHSDESKIEPGPGTSVFGLKRKRKNLYHRINQRVERMMKDGFLDEVKSLLDKGFTIDDPGLNTVGYREAIHHLNENLTLKQMKEEIKTKTRQYAKRQITWFRRWDFITWIDLDLVSEEEAVENIVRNLAAKSNKV